MESPTKDFYEDGRGNPLIDPLFFPPEVEDFLKKEELILLSIKDSLDLLIEVGCMQGRYLDWAVAEKKPILASILLVLLLTRDVRKFWSWDYLQQIISLSKLKLKILLS